MLFSLRDKMNLGDEVSEKQIRKELKEIRKIYRQERGYFKSCKVTLKKICHAFLMYEVWDNKQLQVSNEEVWRDFVTVCKEGGAAFLDFYI